MTLNKLTADALVDGTLDADAIGPASITTAKLHSNIISGQTAIGAVDASNDLLLIYDNDATSLKKVPVSSVGATNTDSITEGSSNLYYTNARADARAQLKIDALVDSAPGTLDTLNELAAALGDDANFSTTVTNSIATKLPLAGGTMTGSLILNSSSDLTVGNVGYWGGTSYGKLTWSATNNRAIVRGESGKNLSLGANGTQDYVFIKTDGNVGIGGSTITDVNLLNIQGDGSTKNVGIVLNKTNSTAQIWSMQVNNTTGGLYFYNYTASNTPVAITTSGNVGIGNTSPSDQLAGAANLVIGTTSDTDTGMTFVSTTTGQSLIHFSDANSGNARYDGFIGYEQNNQAMKFGTAQAERMRITSGGVLQGLSDAEIITSPIRKHSNTISTNTTISTTENAIAGGPINVATGVTLTINGNFTVV